MDTSEKHTTGKPKGKKPNTVEKSNSKETSNKTSEKKNSNSIASKQEEQKQVVAQTVPSSNSVLNSNSPIGTESTSIHKPGPKHRKNKISEAPSPPKSKGQDNNKSNPVAANNGNVKDVITNEVSTATVPTTRGTSSEIKVINNKETVSSIDPAEKQKQPEARSRSTSRNTENPKATPEPDRSLPSTSQTANPVSVTTSTEGTGTGIDRYQIEHGIEELNEFDKDLKRLFKFLKDSKSGKKKALRNKFNEKDYPKMWASFRKYIETFFLKLKSDDARNIELGQVKVEPIADYEGSDFDQKIQNYKKQITSLEGQLEELRKENKEINNRKRKADKDITEQEEVIKKLRRTNGDLSNRLAMEMGKKVSANELAVENVSIKHRPMNIAEDYSQFCANEWLDAKNTLDKSKDMPEHKKIQVLHEVFQVVGTEVSQVMDKMKEETDGVFSKLYKPDRFIYTEKGNRQSHRTTIHMDSYKGDMDTKIVTSSTPAGGRYNKNPQAKSKEDNDPTPVPVELTNAVGDFLRNTADIVDLNELIKNVTLKVQENFNKLEFSDLWQAVIEEEDMKTYIKKLVAITWKMSIQRPPMYFKYSDEWLGDKCQDKFWGSVEEKNAKVFEVYPMMFHGQQIMVKGKVLLVDPKSVKNTEPKHLAVHL